MAQFDESKVINTLHTDRVKFVSYDGEYPCLCMGKLVLNIDGSDVQFPSYCLSSGGSCGFDDDWNDWISKGDWSVNVPEEYKDLKDEITKVVNDNIPNGCCGGCL